MKISIIAGARPNFIKIAPIIKAIKARQQMGDIITYRLIHTGQHYDDKMSLSFFDSLKIPLPDVNFDVRSGSQATQTSKIMIATETEFITHPPDVVLVVGDVNSTMACTIVAKKLYIKVAHVEAGLRSYDLQMPEEINRMITDSISDIFFTTTLKASKNLLDVGQKKESIHFVGNTMIDTLVQQQDFFTPPKIWENLGLIDKKYFLLTMHRPSNVDNIEALKCKLSNISKAAHNTPIVFPVHPRTKSQFDLQGYIPQEPIFVCEALPYLEFMFLLKHSKAVLTDSGGIQEESTYLGIPCITMRENTERPETIALGTNVLIGNDDILLKKSMEQVVNNKWKKGRIPDLWDGKTAERIVEVLLKINSVC